MNRISGKLRLFPPELAAVLSLAVLTVILFLPSLNYEYAPIDDKLYTYENTYVKQGLTLDSIRWALTSTEQEYWIPVTRISYLADVTIFGITPYGFRCTNILLHALNVFLLFYLLKKTTGSLWPAAMTAALFAVHPLRIESVVWITERKDVLCTMWGLVSILLYVNWQAKEKKRPAVYLASLLCFFISLCAKPLWVMMPALLLLFDLWPLGRVGAGLCRDGLPGFKASLAKKTPFLRLFIEKIPYGLLSLLFAGMTVYTQNAAILSAAARSQGHSSGRIPLMLSNYEFYIKKLFYPVDLAFVYVRQEFISPAEWGLAAIVLTVLTIIALGLIKKAPYLTAGWFWYLIALFPVSGIIRVGLVTRADRFSYLPSIGLLFALVWVVYESAQRLSIHARRTTLAVLFLIPVLLAAQTRSQMVWWATAQSLLRHTIELTGGMPDIHNNLGTLLSNSGKHEEAILHFDEAIRMEPGYVEALYNKGLSLMALNRPEEALQYYERARRNAPQDVEIISNMGVVLGMLGRSNEEIRCYQQALEIEPQSVVANLNLGHVLLKAGDTNGAIRHYEAVLQADPENVSALVSLAVLSSGQGKSGKAVEMLRKALRLAPDRIPIREQLGYALCRQGIAFQLQKRFKDAIACYEEAIANQPNRPDAYNNLAWLLAVCPDAAFRNGTRAVECAQRAVRLGGESPSLLDTLAAAQAENGQYQQAAATADRAIDLIADPKDPSIMKLRARRELYLSGTPYRETR